MPLSRAASLLVERCRSQLCRDWRTVHLWSSTDAKHEMREIISQLLQVRQSRLTRGAFGMS